MTAIAALFAFGLAFGSARTVRIPTGTRPLLWALLVIGWALAYYAGRHRRPAAVAIATAVSISEATATADARQQVNVFVAPVDLSKPGAAGAGYYAGHVGADQVPAVPAWTSEELSVYERHVELMDDMDPAELVASDERGELVERD